MNKISNYNRQDNIRIVHILHGRELAGMEKICIDLCNELSKSYKVKLITGEHFKKYIIDTVDYTPLDLEKSRNNPFFLYQLYKIIKDFSPNIIHVHKQKSIQIIKRLEPFLKIPFVATKHDMKKKKAFYGLRYAITITDEVKQTIKSKNIYKIYNGIPYHIAKKINMPNGFNIVAIGGLKKIKAYDKIIESVAELSFPCHLTLVGEGVLREKLEKRIKTLGIEDRVSLVGFQLNVHDYLYSADLQIISSISEGFSLAMIEGIFSSKIMISTKVSGCTELLPDTLLYNISDLTEKINDVYKNVERYKDIFNEVKIKYKDRLTIEVCALEHIDVYNKIIKDYYK